MPHPAFQLVGAELEQTGGPEMSLEPLAAPEVSATTRDADEARRLELEAAFLMFGVKEPAADGDAEISAERVYQTQSAPGQAANDDAAPGFAFPDLKHRGLHVDAALPVRFIQCVDWIFVAAAAELAARWGAGLGVLDLHIGLAVAFIAAAGALKVGLWITEFYRTTPARIRAERGVGGLALGAILSLGVAAFCAPDARSTAALATIIPLTAMVMAGVHAALAVWIRAAHRKGVFAETVVLVGATDAARRLAERAARSGEARIVAVVDDRLSRSPPSLGAAPVGGTLGDLLAWEGLPHVDRIVITVSQKAEARVRAMIERLRVAPNRIELLLVDHAESVRGRRVERLTGAAVACVSGRPRNTSRAMLKRVQDIVVASAALIVCAVPMLAIAIAVKLTSRGPVLYRQRRHGFNNRIITILKFRTLRHDPGAPLRQVTPDDPRITRIGGFLRRTSLDELPQLFNVLGGSMSVVGPRPHAIGMKAADRDLAHIVAEYAHRHRVKPGITGWAQVNGSRGPIETAAAVRKRVKYDLEYVSRASLWLDLEILLRTAPAIFGDRKAAR